jgi:alkylation response protein AidB-like acyl-CoA dehydrogenase
MQVDSREHVRSTVRAVAERIAPLVPQGERERRIPPEALRLLAESGCLGRTLPVAFGGSAAGVAVFAAQQEELAAVWPTAAVACTWANLSGRLLARFASPGLQVELMPASSTALGSARWPGPNHGGALTLPRSRPLPGALMAAGC